MTLRRKRWCILTCFHTRWHMASTNPVFTLLSASPSLDSRSQINLKCLPSHKSQALPLPFPPPSPTETQWTQSSWLPHHRWRPMGSRPSRSSIISLNMWWAAVWFVDAFLSMANPPDYYRGVSSRSPSAGQFINYLIESREQLHANSHSTVWRP